ncbi:MAG: putative sporulation protein YtxC [Bacillota bacterium]|jgi:putative sporulation protein YtxC
MAASTISIGTSKNSDAIRFILGKEFRSLKGEGINVSLKESNLGDYTFIDCSINEVDKPEQDMILRHNVANVISDFIINYWEQRILNKITRDNFCFLTKEEMENVVNKARKILESTSQPDELFLYRLNRKSKILHEILDYLSLNTNINIDGFINFRLHDYVDDLYNILQQAVDEFMLEKEYREFILLLKYFVEIQEPKVEKIHVFLMADGYFQLLDDDNKAYNQQCFEGCIIDMVDKEINYEDLLISTLITIAPKKIILHIPDSSKVKNMLDTIEEVFDKQVVRCNGCPQCSQRTHQNH